MALSLLLLGAWLLSLLPVLRVAEGLLRTVLRVAVGLLRGSSAWPLCPLLLGGFVVFSPVLARNGFRKQFGRASASQCVRGCVGIGCGPLGHPLRAAVDEPHVHRPRPYTSLQVFASGLEVGAPLMQLSVILLLVRLRLMNRPFIEPLGAEDARHCSLPGPGRCAAGAKLLVDAAR